MGAIKEELERAILKYRIGNPLTSEKGARRIVMNGPETIEYWFHYSPFDTVDSGVHVWMVVQFEDLDEMMSNANTIMQKCPSNVGILADRDDLKLYMATYYEDIIESSFFWIL